MTILYFLATTELSLVQVGAAISIASAVSLPAGPVVGVEGIVRAIAALADSFRGQTLVERTVNGQPDLVAQRDGTIVSVYAFVVAGDRIKYIWAIRNPDKLRSWTDGEPT